VAHDADRTHRTTKEHAMDHDTIEDKIRDEYCSALANFRTGDSRPFEVYCAALLDAASTLLDPAGVMFIGSDATVGDAYDSVNSQVWRRLIGPAREHRLDEALVRSILRDEYGSHFGTWFGWAEDDQWRVVRVGTAADAPDGTNEMARLVHERLSRSEDSGEPRLFITNH
jgi:hypothetical protein